MWLGRSLLVRHTIESCSHTRPACCRRSVRTLLHALLGTEGPVWALLCQLRSVRSPTSLTHIQQRYVIHREECEQLTSHAKRQVRQAWLCRGPTACHLQRRSLSACQSAWGVLPAGKCSSCKPYVLQISATSAIRFDPTPDRAIVWATGPQEKMPQPFWARTLHPTSEDLDTWDGAFKRVHYVPR